MKDYILHNRQGQFVVIGTIFLLLGFATANFNDVLSTGAYYISMFFLGFYAAKNAVVETINEKSPNVDLLMILAALGAALIQYESEGAALLFVFAVAEVLEDYATNKSTAAISELMAQVPEKAKVLQANGEVVEVLTDDLQKEDVVVVARGEQIPIDGYVDRHVLVNESALTGESIPVSKDIDEEVFAGTINEGNAFHIRVSKLASETVFSNIIRMVEEAQNRPSKISKFIDRIESKYVISVLIAVPIFIFILMQFQGYTFDIAFYRGMVLLTVASPCALVASATPATLAAISNAAKNGILFKGGAAMEALSTMDTLYTDKTGTLTYGDFQVVSYQVDDALLKEVVYMEQQSSHPIGGAIVQAFKDIDLTRVDHSEAVEEIAGKGVKKGATTVGKPSAFDTHTDPQNFRCHLHAANTTVFVGDDHEILGYISLADQVRPQSAYAIQAFQNDGVDVVLLTGDNEAVAKEVAGALHIDHYKAGMLPEDKIAFVLESQDKDQVAGMIGDGINDAPALANADIGIAMGSGASVAMESSDIVIVKNNLAKLYFSYELSKKLNQLILQNVIFAVGVIITLVLLNLFGVLGLPLAVLCHEGSTILVILNGLRLLHYKDANIENTEAPVTVVQAELN